MTDYISRLEKAIEQCRWLMKKESITFEFPESAGIGFIKGNIHFINDSTLVFSEIISSQKSSDEINYRFHYMDKNRRLINRWDSAPHHPKIKTFPFHCHTPKGVVESQAMSLINILNIIASLVIKDLSL